MKSVKFAVFVFMLIVGCMEVVRSKDEKVCGNDNATENIKHCDQVTF